MNEKILIIEDEKDLRDMYSSILVNEGYDVLTEENFKNALKRLDNNRIDLIFTDIMLGGKTGVDVLREVKERALTCPVVMITGVPTVDTATEAVRLGAYDYIPKPVAPETLIRVASMALRFKMLNDSYETSRKNLEAIFRSVKDAIITVNEDLNIIEMNEAAEGLCGLKKSSLGMPIDHKLNNCGRKCLDILRETIQKKKPVEGHVECMHVNNLRQVVTVNTYPLITDSKLISGVVMVLRDETRLVALERDLKERRQFHKIIGSSKKMQEIYSLIEDLTNVNTTVLITGETGTGKELAAEALHYTGVRKEKPLVKVNCAALSENLLDSELFGHVKGSFTGAIRDKPGRFETAAGGTILLDEIGDISPLLQTKLLRVLQDKKIERVGDTVSRTIDVRVVAATNKNLRNKIRQGEFREDLFYRLKVVEIKLPPLRERKEDIPFLVEHFLEKLSRKFNKKISAVSDEIMDLFMEHLWPGNVRELEHELEHACIRCRKLVISLDDLSFDFREFIKKGEPERAGKETEREPILKALEKSGWNKAKAARILGMSRGTLYKLIRQYDLE